jgi:hypothetical protein
MNAAARLLIRIWHLILPLLGCLNCGKDADPNRSDDFCSDPGFDRTPAVYPIRLSKLGTLGKHVPECWHLFALK